MLVLQGTTREDSCKTMNTDAIAKVAAVAGGSAVGALLGNAVVPGGTVVPSIGAGVVAGLVKQNWSLMQAAESSGSKEGTLSAFFKFPIGCAARIGFITALLHYFAPITGSVKEKIALAGWLGGASEVFIVDPMNL